MSFKNLGYTLNSVEERNQQNYFYFKNIEQLISPVEYKVSIIKSRYLTMSFTLYEPCRL